jgi:hypothetical protein
VTDGQLLQNPPARYAQNVTHHTGELEIGVSRIARGGIKLGRNKPFSNWAKPHRQNHWCRQYRHEPVRDQWVALKRKLAGHFAYFGITGNSYALSNFRFQVIAVWWKWLSRRSQRVPLSWEKMLRLLACYPLPERTSGLRTSRSETVDRRAGCENLQHVWIRGSLGGVVLRGGPDRTLRSLRPDELSRLLKN